MPLITAVVEEPAYWLVRFITVLLVILMKFPLVLLMPITVPAVEAVDAAVIILFATVVLPTVLLDIVPGTAVPV